VRAERTLDSFRATLERSPAALSEMLLALDFHRSAVKEIAIVAPAARADAQPLLARMQTSFAPNRVLAVAVQGDDLAAQARVVPLLEGKVASGGKATAYVCEKGRCALPTSDPQVFAAQLTAVASPSPAPSP
jgi:uncharacterized protein YyaL (SSP411 family)